MQGQRLENHPRRQRLNRFSGLIFEDVAEYGVAEIGVFRLAHQRRVEGAEITQRAVAVELVIEVFPIAQVGQQMLQRQQVHWLARQSGGVRHQLQERDVFGVCAQPGLRRQQHGERIVPVQTPLIDQQGDRLSGDPFAQRAEGKERIRGNRVAIFGIGHAVAVKFRRAVMTDNRHHHAAHLLALHIVVDEGIDGEPMPVLPYLTGFVRRDTHLRKRSGASDKQHRRQQHRAQPPAQTIPSCRTRYRVDKKGRRS